MQDDLICGINPPHDLIDVLKKYGLPEHVTRFSVTCNGPYDPIEVECTFYPRIPKKGETFDQLEVTKRYQLVEMK